MSQTNLFDLTGRVALVTGASRGIGESVARTLADYGAHVIVSSRKIDACEAVAQSIREGGGSAEAVACHIGEMEQIDAIWDHIGETHGKLDILVNNAAANPYFGPIEDTDLGAFQKTVDVNIRGYFFMCARGAQLMKKAGGGSIVNVASVNGVNPGHFQGIYSITKAAVISMTKSFAMELGQQGVRVNALLPGLTDTRFASALTSNDAIKKQAMAHIPMKRVADPSEMAGTVLYLVSDASTYTTGACINADGGYLTI
ncbi:SDR family oxidoreductase [Marinobacter persicus]|uniref:NAD(P)-dependent dehydrogenase (Short-subunit alcohol dehydrogenase family) n=1 Tax=Marinobacter persicus TaxID=930118 RepID=A0A2S6G4X8_9GAMM|nr:SDR family oxidoreductase [Marinobacter persicus]PPK50915.1 NAD(P)-dependent dehydrogenase (short-subunit alcohol dehydrogenase family) [Marinobacter persicus]PPK54029.1 NAD(P)-dependent dehydrogenase (short-subunit alcohol dehydrogenase family) [Marinobacter persicus]PPK57204.1 NAD(P)-dependent dehydrogenase (short-subunit alcohol dehydrogenase family) [Marinobacter persicus]